MPLAQEAGESGVRGGWTVSEVDGKEDPWWHQMHVQVALSPQGKPIPFTFTDREGKTHEREIEPFRDANYDIPFIGVAPPWSMKLIRAAG